MEMTEELKALIEQKAQEIAEAKAQEIAEAKTQEIVSQITTESEDKIAKLNEAHAAEIKTYKDSITAIIRGKNEDKPEKTQMEILVDEINERRRNSK